MNAPLHRPTPRLWYSRLFRYSRLIHLLLALIQMNNVRIGPQSESVKIILNTCWFTVVKVVVLVFRYSRLIHLLLAWIQMDNVRIGPQSESVKIILNTCWFTVVKVVVLVTDAFWNVKVNYNNGTTTHILAEGERVTLVVSEECDCWVSSVVVCP